MAKPMAASLLSTSTQSAGVRVSVAALLQGPGGSVATSGTAAHRNKGPKAGAWLFRFSLYDLPSPRNGTAKEIAALRRLWGLGGVVYICGDVSEGERASAIGIWP
jgi:hypothetical protein